MTLENESKNEIAILDFGSQYTHLIARRIREFGVVSHIYPNDISADKLKNAVGIILSGGPRSIVSEEPLPYDKKLFDLNIPVLGLCYGHQLIANHFGGQVNKGGAREYGTAKLLIKNQNSIIFRSIASSSIVWMSHGDHVEKMPEGFLEAASSGNESITAMENSTKNIFGFQFHPEVHHSEFGNQMLMNFVLDICKAKKNWSTDKMLQQIQEDIKQQAGNKKVFLLVSGGVDSTVCFALLEKVLGKDKVYGFHVDHGFMRKDESEEVKKALTKIGLDDLHVYNAENEYLKALKNVSEPEEKRKIIGDLFLDITEKIMAELKFNENEWLLGQGTIYPDTIESGGTKNADKIKTHHNRVDRVTDMIEKGLIIEPIKELYKDEVREIGKALGLPDHLINRHPFPGPGLAIRCLCSDGTDEKVEIVNWQDKKLAKLPIKSVGVQGDERTYAHPVVLLNEKTDWNNLHHLSPKITNSLQNINRVLIPIYGDVDKLNNSKVKKAYLTKNRIDMLKELDYKINKIVLPHPAAKKIWQMPIVLVPFGHDQGESLILRPIASKEVMTVTFADLPNEVIEQIRSEAQNTSFLDYIFFDITNKPPGTVEWE